MPRRPPGRIPRRITASTADEPYVYAAAGGGMVKIGVTIHVGRRLGQLAEESGHPLRLLAAAPGGFDTERAIHRILARHRAGRGREWYDPTPEVYGVVDAMALVARTLPYFSARETLLSVVRQQEHALCGCACGKQHAP